jgi:uncharacterized protein (DUF305 family)
MKHTRIILSGLIAIALLSACAGSSDTNTGTDVVEAVTDFNDDDVMFAQMMIPHHEQAIEMSEIALDPTVEASEVVKSLATRIMGAQDPEIATMKGFLTTWNMGLTMDTSMDHSDMMSGMLSADELAELSTLRGAAFDRAWMSGMIKHHEGAIEMAADVLKDGKNAEVKALANTITSAQDAEILEMKELLG